MKRSNIKQVGNAAVDKLWTDDLKIVLATKTLFKSSLPKTSLIEKIPNDLIQEVNRLGLAKWDLKRSLTAY